MPQPHRAPPAVRLWRFRVSAIGRGGALGGLAAPTSPQPTHIPKESGMSDPQIFTRTDAITGDTTERTVITAADEVRAKFDGFRAKAAKKAADKPADKPAQQGQANGDAAK